MLLVLTRPAPLGGAGDLTAVRPARHLSVGPEGDVYVPLYNKEQNLRCKRPSAAETKVSEPVVGIEPVAARRAEEGRIKEKGAAAHDTVIAVAALDPSGAVRRRAGVAVMIAILRPLPHITHHVIETEPISGKRADRGGL